MSPYGTRASNVDKHPGQIVLDADRKRRRSIEEVAAEQLDQEMTAAANQREHAMLLQRIAELEALSRVTEGASVAPSAPPKKKQKGSKATKATSKTSTATPVEAGSLPSLTSAKRGKPKPRRADVDKLAVEEEEVVGVKESRRGKRKSDLDSATPTYPKKQKPTHPSGLKLSLPYREPPPLCRAPTPPPNLTSEDTGVKYGGYVDSDNEVEFVEADVEPGGRSTAQGVVKIEKNATLEDTAARILRGVAAVKATALTHKYTMKDIYELFPGPEYRYLWAEKFIPEMLYFMGNRLDIWNATGVNWPISFRTIWENVMPDSVAENIPRTDPHSALATIAFQRTFEYRHGMSKHSVQDAGDLFREQGMGPVEIAKHVSELLSRGLPFLSLKTTFDPTTGKAVREGRFQSPLILRTFAYHLKRTGKLALEFTDTPDGALALATVAVERTLMKYKTGSLSVLKNRNGHNIDAFSYKIWGMKTNQYVDSIANLSESEWEAILEGAEQYIGNDAGKVNGDCSDSDDGDTPLFLSDDERANI